jgi:hypothetical protein
LAAYAVLPKGGFVRAKTRTLIFAFLLLAPFAALHGTGSPAVCGEDDLTFGCTMSPVPGRLRAGWSVDSGTRFFA